MKQEDSRTIVFDDATIARLLQDTDKQTINRFKVRLVSEYKLLEELDAKKTLTFRNATIDKLMEIVNIKPVIDDNKFDAWFNYEYKLSEEENKFLKHLIKENKLSLIHYNEIKLTIKFIAPILTKVKFDTEDFTDWYGYKMECELNDYVLKGEPDFAVATGISVPKKPYFFLQEYKRAVNPTGNPEYQALAAMLAAMTLNNTNTIRGGYIIGRLWNFITLEKLENGNYEYFVSNGFDCLKFIDLKQIYINLQAVKFLYCK